MIYYCLLLVFVYSLSRYYDLSMLAMSTDSPWWTTFTFPMLHTGLYHLACNCFVLLSFWSITKHRKQASVIVLLAICLSCLCADDIPTAGSSGIATALIGITLADLLLNGYYGTFAKLGAIVLAVISVQAAFGAGLVNSQLHILSLFVAMLCRTIWMSYVQIKKESR